MSDSVFFPDALVLSICFFRFPSWRRSRVFRGKSEEIRTGRSLRNEYRIFSDTVTRHAGWGLNYGDMSERERKNERNTWRALDMHNDVQRPEKQKIAIESERKKITSLSLPMLEEEGEEEYHVNARRNRIFDGGRERRVCGRLTESNCIATVRLSR